MGGSYQDQERLVRALEKFETFDAHANMAGASPTVVVSAAGAAMDLLRIARTCGYRGDVPGLEAWATKRTTAFLSQTGRTHDKVEGFANIAENGRPSPNADGTFCVYARFSHDRPAQPVSCCRALVQWVGSIDPGAPVYWNEIAKSYNSTCGVLMPGWVVDSATPLNHAGLCLVRVP